MIAPGIFFVLDQPAGKLADGRCAKANQNIGGIFGKALEVAAQPAAGGRHGKRVAGQCEMIEADWRISVLTAQRGMVTQRVRQSNQQGRGYSEQSTATAEQLRLIRAPVNGEIVGLTVHTQGGVVAPGQKLMDIVPSTEPFIIQARISPDDADDLTLGQHVQIKFAGLHERSLPNLEGRLQRLSADSFTDEKTGQGYFTADVSLQRDQLKLIQNVRGANFLLRAGMPVQVLIPLRKRSALDYALEPLIGSFWSSFREH